MPNNFRNGRDSQSDRSIRQERTTRYFGTLGVGDPACDLMVAWTFLTPESRHIFRTELQADDAAWARGSGWALSFGLIAYAYYLDTNPILAVISRRAIDDVIIEYKYGLR